MFMSVRWSGLLAGIAASALLAGAAHAADGGSSAEEIVVTGDRPTTEAISGTKSNTPLIETPQSISVIDASEIAGLGLQNLNQALRFVSGVTPETRGASAEVYDQFKLRGFDAPVYLDGLKQFGSPSGYVAPQVDVSRLERIEIVKGPASALYGASSPGGFIAEESKLPIARDFYGAMSATYGNDDLYRIDADVGGQAEQFHLHAAGRGNGVQFEDPAAERPHHGGQVLHHRAGEVRRTGHQLGDKRLG